MHNAVIGDLKHGYIAHARTIHCQ